MWILYENCGEISAFDDVIDSIMVDSNKEIRYYLKETCDDYSEEDIFPYSDSKELAQRMYKLMGKIREEEKTDD